VTPIPFGQIVLVHLPARVPPGHEQQGLRPSLLVADPSMIQAPRFPVLLVTPMTSTRLPVGPLYPHLAKGAGGLAADSTVLLDQLTTIDARRVRGYLGRLSDIQAASIRQGLERLLSF
jgi:mRNA interferase MazF